ncbi:MAG TPA: 16S rRNA (cytosine(1402)-N(4))-methyltransferase, partial [Propionicimonas sp.]|nr:16S rRNA (cytosine(1402)-N(4))-methyltransferase [Propionicimonas sp.]
MGEVTGGAAALHVPVMAGRIVELLSPALAAPGSVYVDGTLGMGGHAQLLLEACPNARLVGIDRDPNALALAGERLAGFG